jgi:hypothetical protein
VKLEMKELKLKLKPFDWLAIDHASINIGWTVDAETEETEGYDVSLNLFVTGGKVEEFPIIIETEIFAEDMAQAVREALAVVIQLTPNILEEIVVFNEDGNEEYVTSISEILQLDDDDEDEEETDEEDDEVKDKEDDIQKIN